MGEGWDSGGVTLEKGAALGEGVTPRGDPVAGGTGLGVADGPGRDDPWGCGPKGGRDPGWELTMGWAVP